MAEKKKRARRRGTRRRRNSTKRAGTCLVPVTTVSARGTEKTAFVKVSGIKAAMALLGKRARR